MRLFRHELGKAVLVAAEVFGDGDGSVVRRLRHHRLDRILDGNGLTGLQAEFCRRLLGGVPGNLERRVELDFARFESLEQQIERHDLGQRRRVARRVGVRRVQHVAGVAVDDNRGRWRRIAFGMKAVVSARCMRRDHRVARMVHVVSMVTGVG
jgi:hypothetical protein